MSLRGRGWVNDRESRRRLFWRAVRVKFFVFREGSKSRGMAASKPLKGGQWR